MNSWWLCGLKLRLIGNTGSRNNCNSVDLTPIQIRSRPTHSTLQKTGRPTRAGPDESPKPYHRLMRKKSDSLTGSTLTLWIFPDTDSLLVTLIQLPEPRLVRDCSW